jgi:putative ABC transport system ATP-binding protein
MQQQQPILKIQNLNYYFGSGNLQRQVLSNICLEILPGEVLIMTGPSGIMLVRKCKLKLVAI